jgi:DNA-binding transcriptional MerR regulator
MNFYSSNDIINILQKEGYNINKRSFVYYATEKKILPEPYVHNNKPKYIDRHIDYLKAILIVKEKGNTLNEIKKELDKLNDEELKLISTMYQPFNSKEMIEETKKVYYDYANTNTTTTSMNSMANVNGMTDNLLASNNVDASNFAGLQSNIFSNSQSFVSENSSNAKSTNADFSLNSMSAFPQSVYRSAENYVSKSVDNTRMQRTIINENIVLETKNINHEILKELINQIEIIYKNNTGDGNK